MTKRVVLHVGMGKTGSSALQVALARNRQALAERGVYYPESESDADAVAGRVVSGNGMDLLDFLAPRGQAVTPERAEAARQAILTAADEAADGTAVLYSSEFLYQHRPNRLDELDADLAARGADLHVVVYVRDIAGHALSSYSQVVKRALFTGTLGDYLSDDGPYRLNLKPRLQRLTRALGRERVRVLHYDSNRRDLFGSFLRALDVDATGLDGGHGQVNRSLTRHEIELMRYANVRLAGKVRARRISDALIARPPLAGTSLTLTATEAAVLDERYGEDVAWIREVFPDVPLEVVGDVVVDDLPPDLEIGTEERFLLDCMVDMANRR